jgi:hypothetical protein
MKERGNYAIEANWEEGMLPERKICGTLSPRLSPFHRATRL